jgi:hypothetical protein
MLILVILLLLLLGGGGWYTFPAYRGTTSALWLVLVVLVVPWMTGYLGPRP